MTRPPTPARDWLTLILVGIALTLIALGVAGLLAILLFAP